jgi:hypothetical protein
MSVLFLDIETLPATAVPGVDLAFQAAANGFVPAPAPAEREPPSNYRDAAKIAEWRAAERERHRQAVLDHATAQVQAARDWYAAQSLDPMQCRILCLGYAVDDDEPNVLVGDEAAILAELDDLLGFVRPTRYVAHNGKGFDFPVIQLRAIKHRRYGICRALHQDKPWDAKLIDTLEEWPSTQHGRQKQGGTMDRICSFLEIERTDNPISGRDVLVAYVEGRMDEIVAHCRADIRDLRAVYQVTSAIRGRAA